MVGRSVIKWTVCIAAALMTLQGCKTTSSNVESAAVPAEAVVSATLPKAYGIFTATVKPKFAGTAEYLFYLFCASQTLPPYNAHAVAWGDDHISLEGSYTSGYVMVLEFPNIDSFHTWYNREPYSTVKRIRFDATDGIMSILQEGVPGTVEHSTVTPKGSPQKKAFAILSNKITDRDGYAAYLSKADESVARHGGRAIVQGQKHEELEGHVDPDNVEIYEFATMDALKDWYHSSDYQAMIAERQKSSETVFLIGQQGIAALK